MVSTDLSLHVAVIYNLNTGQLEALQPEKAGEIHLAALDIRTPEAELGRRLFHCTLWSSRGRTQLQNTFGLAQLLSDNPASSDFMKTALQQYYAARAEFRDDPEKIRQLTELLIDDVKEVAADSRLRGLETMAHTPRPLQVGKYWSRGKWEIMWPLYKSLGKIHYVMNWPGTRGSGEPTEIPMPTPSIPDFRSDYLELFPADTDPKVATVIPIWFGTNRERVENPDRPAETFGNRRDRTAGVNVHYGLARVSIPLRHDEGKIERPKWWKLERVEDEARHFVLKKVTVLDEAVWIEAIKAASVSEADGVVFVHGFNVTFEDAMYRSAQLAKDLKYEKQPVFCFSWASCGRPTPTDYTTDEGTIQWSEDHLEKFLTTITRKLGLKRLHVIAHSMGNRAVLGVLTRWVKAQNAAPLSQLVLAAPDLDAGTLANRSPHFSKCDRVTLYASRSDWAIGVSREIHTYPIAGDADPPVVVAGVDTIDATIAGEDVLGLGHSYFAQKSKIFGDLFYVITQLAIPAAKRAFLRPVTPPGYYELF